MSSVLLQEEVDYILELMKDEFILDEDALIAPELDKQELDKDRDELLK